MSKKSVLITGANGGIGFATYQSLSSKPGFRCITHVRNNRSLTQLKKRASILDKDIFVADFSNIDELEKKLIKANLRIDVLINTVGNYEVGDFVKDSFIKIQKQLYTNFLSCLLLIHHFSIKMKRNGGHIINISSGSGVHGGVLPSFGYSSAKNSINFMTKILPKEFDRYNIKINTLIVRYADTKMLIKFKKYYKNFTKKRFLTSLRIYQPTEIADKIFDLLINKNIKNGQIIELK